MTEIKPAGAAVDTSPYVEFGDRYLTFKEETPFEVWSEVVGRLKSAEKSIQWWLGDALLFGERKYGEMYSQALEETDYAYGTLRNAAWVAGKIELSRRHDNLPYAHHVAVAPLPPEEQERLLAEAAPEPGERRPRLSASELRERGKSENGHSEASVVVIEAKQCPSCGAESQFWQRVPGGVK